jgi:hypothetical protein
MQIESSSEPLKVTIRNFAWSRLAGGAMLLHLAWTAALLYVVFGLRVGGDSMGDGLLLFGLLAWQAYYLLLFFLNSTRIRVLNGFLEVDQGPIPAWGGCRIPASDIRRFSTGQMRYYRLPETTYYLTAHLAGGREESILWGARDQDEVLSVQRQLERHLGLKA